MDATGFWDHLPAVYCLRCLNWYFVLTLSGRRGARTWLGFLRIFWDKVGMGKAKERRLWEWGKGDLTVKGHGMITLLERPITLGFTDRNVFLSWRRYNRRRHNLVYTCSSGSFLVSSWRTARLHCIYCTRPRLHLNTIKHNIIKSPTAIPTWVFSKIETTPLTEWRGPFEFTHYTLSTLQEKINLMNTSTWLQ